VLSTNDNDDDDVSMKSQSIYNREKTRDDEALVYFWSSHEHRIIVKGKSAKESRRKVVFVYTAAAR
tara:strand:+ start:481 stop:678 length:198 start_codon:yes stop_codon:yes gene_type:complete